jgi:hypothetical protein
MTRKTQTKQTATLIDREHGHHLLYEMLRIRRFEEKCAELYTALKIRGFMHLYDGEEASTVVMPLSPAACRWRWGWRWPIKCAACHRLPAAFMAMARLLKALFTRL